MGVGVYVCWVCVGVGVWRAHLFNNRRTFGTRTLDQKSPARGFAADLINFILRLFRLASLYLLLTAPPFFSEQKEKNNNEGVLYIKKKLGCQ